MVEQIEQLLTAPASGADAPTLARMEETLTDGYAQVLALEAERWRLERRLGEIALKVEDHDVSAVAGELSTLAKGITTADGRATELRTLLGTLHERTRSLRVAERAASL